MVLRDVWNDLTEDCRRVFSTVVGGEEMLDGEAVLGGIARLDRPVGKLLRTLNDDHGLGLVIPDRLVDDTGGPPDSVLLSAHLRETLNFFRFHRMKPITPEALALRLLQMSSGEVDRKLENTGRFQEILAEMESMAQPD